jgi:hypothetical protein
MLHTKEATDYTGPESYVSKKLQDKKIDFFPVNQAFVLKEREKQDDTDKARLNSDVVKTKSAIQVRTSTINTTCSAMCCIVLCLLRCVAL